MRAEWAVDITNKRGLHARASAKFVTLASTLPCEVSVSKDGTPVTGTSIMGLMMLGATMGDSITISAAGAGAEETVAALARLVEDKFGADSVPRESTAYSTPLIKRVSHLPHQTHRLEEDPFLPEGRRILTQTGN